MGLGHQANGEGPLGPGSFSPVGLQCQLPDPARRARDRQHRSRRWCLAVGQQPSFSRGPGDEWQRHTSNVVRCRSERSADDEGRLLFLRHFEEGIDCAVSEEDLRGFGVRLSVHRDRHPCGGQGSRPFRQGQTGRVSPAGGGRRVRHQHPQPSLLYLESRELRQRHRPEALSISSAPLGLSC